MDSRREFIRKAMMLSGAAGMATLPASIQKALAINPEVGSTFLDADYIVILMQENRSFDHAFGTLRGVRGFNDPRAMQLPNGNPVWLQTNKNGETYSPFRLDIKDTKITWMGSLPHGRDSQVEARNNGRNDNWLEAKKPGGEYNDMPLTMGHYTREDIPFYYALADAFTICDQNFCSSLTGTDPNRCHFWSGTIRAEKDEDSKAYTFNGDIEAGVNWRTFPELMEENNISWKVYQNEVSLDRGATEEEDRWLGNFGCNVLSYFGQYHVKFLKSYVDFLPKRIELLKADISALQSKLSGLTSGSDEYKKVEQQLTYQQTRLQHAQDDQEKYTVESFDSLAAKQKSLHKKAFIENVNDPDQKKLVALNYMDDTINREINIPGGDVLYQFRKDVEDGNLPTVSWLVAPENFSDHPDAPWFGSWYLSEAMDILTKNPEVWKKTIFILAYDENDGYFDHVPTFIPPEFGKPETGLASAGIDTRLDYVIAKDDVPGPIGLGYRVPLVIASPWSRGGYVNSQVFDHTSTLQFLEIFLNKKFGKQIWEDNITQWRRTICGDLTSVFREYHGEKIESLPFLKKEPFIESVHKAKFKNAPTDYKKLTDDEIDAINKSGNKSSYLPLQENGSRPACALPYELYVDGNLNTNDQVFEIIFKASKQLIKNAVGAPFIVQARNFKGKDFVERAYAIAAGDTLKDSFPLNEFVNGEYKLEVYGPNGFYRMFKGDNKSLLNVSVKYSTDMKGFQNGDLEIGFQNNNNAVTITIIDNAYKAATIKKQLPARSSQNITLNLKPNSGWYDFSVHADGGNAFEYKFAGHVETGRDSKSDPALEI
ncbi:MAG: phospholipase C, phosphocholine-specific [Bacteroidetes bacterium]|nr:phospholipase C, phosphocholine-specific [Bacteroidota bacterium]